MSPAWAFFTLLIIAIIFWSRRRSASSRQNTARSALCTSSISTWLRTSAISQAAAIRRGDITSEELVREHIDQARKVNSHINAIVSDRFEEAIQEAKEADRLLSSGLTDLGPLHGVPFSVKEAFAVRGLSQASGLLARRHLRCTKDATVVDRIRKAGGIPLGVTNTSELCMWMESSNPLYGCTNNPYNVARTVGGSSGGEAAVVSACAAPFGIGSDIGGSIRIPSFFCGVFGHKPTAGLLPNTGQHPIATGLAGRYLVSGPICRHAEDLMPLLRLMAGSDGQDVACEECSGCFPLALSDPRAVPLSSLRVYSVFGNGAPFLGVDKELYNAQQRACDYFSSVGVATDRSVKFSNLNKSLDIWAACMALAEQTPFGEQLGNGQGAISLWSQLARWPFGLSSHSLPALGLVAVESLAALPFLTPRNRRLAALAPLLRAEIEAVLATTGVLLFPSYTSPAPQHGRPLLLPIQWCYTAIFNVLELPVTQVPLGLSRDGLPLGVQVVGSRGCDHLCIRVALELEKAFGGWAARPE